MSPLPAQFADRWGSQRTGPSYDDSICWHILLGTEAGAQSAAGEAQRRLARFGGFHLTPERWLHVTVMLAGTVNDITPTQRSTMLDTARKALSGTPPITITLERVLYSPEGIVLGISPADALMPVMTAARSATAEATGSSDGEAGYREAEWTPHLTIAYSTREQPAGPVIAALGKHLTARTATVRRLSLVVQNGPEYLWDWTVEGSAELSGALREDPVLQLVPPQVPPSSHEAGVGSSS